MSAPTSPERWRRLEEIFNEAVEMKPHLRPGFIESACGGDVQLKAEVESLLRAEGQSLMGLEESVRQAARAFCEERSPAPLQEGSVLAHYRIVSLLGAGGMGRVYLAEDLSLGRKVALKTLAAGVIHSESGLQRFEQEARAASALNHPNVLTIYEIGQAGGTPFIASEFVDGATLRERLSEGPLEIGALLDIAIQIATGLAVAHAAGIVHRDIKPENIILRKDGIVKIVDFGIAKLGSDPTDSPAPLRPGVATTPGAVLGTVKYMSPEQARGLAVDNRTDLFSLGAVIYEMLDGNPPFEGATNSDIMAEILKSDPVLTLFAPQAPADLVAVIAQAMRKDPDDRYRSASSLLFDLQTCRRELEFSRRAREPVTAPSFGIPTARSAGRWNWLKNVPVRASAAAFAAAAVFAVALFVWNHGARHGASGSPRSLAILPFRNLKPDPATDFLGFSLADAVTTKIGYANSLTVRPSSAVEAYRNRIVDPRKVGAELNVNVILTGSYIREGDDLRITTQLIDVQPDRIIWHDTIDVRYEKLFTVQDRVAQQIITGLELTLSPAEAGNLKFDNPTSRQAYENYLRGVDLYATNNFLGAIGVLEESARIEPNYALTWAHLGRAYTASASLEFGGRDQYRKAQAAYERAIALNPALIEPRVYMANLFTDTGRVEQAVGLLRPVLAANPNTAEAHWELGYAYRFAGMLQESVGECERARTIDPEVKINSSALNSYLYIGQYDKFIASLPQIDSVYILFYRGLGEYYKGDYTHALAHWDRGFEQDSSLLQAQLGRALADSVRHKNAEGLKLLRETESKINQRGVADPEGLYKVSQAYAALGDKPRALDMLRRSIEGGFFCYPYFISDPIMGNLSAAPEFERLVELARQRHERFRASFFSAH